MTARYVPGTGAPSPDRFAIGDRASFRLLFGTSIRSDPEFARIVEEILDAVVETVSTLIEIPGSDEQRVILAKVVGTVVATRKDERLVSSKLLVVRPIDPRGKAEATYLVAVDTVDAGFGETVLIVSGSSARMASGLKDCPVDAAIVGIVDSIEVKD